MKKFITSAFVLTLASISSLGLENAWAQTELKGSPEELRQFLHPQGKVVMIQGNAEKTAYSDKAIIDLVVMTEERLLSDSLTKNSQLRTDISAELVKQGISAEEIKSAKFSSAPEYGFFGDKPKSYKVTNRMSISITDEKQLESIAVLADKYEEAELSGSRFIHTEKEKFEEEVKNLALEKVMASKASYEKSLGVKLVPVGIHNIYIGQNATEGAALFQTQRMERTMDASVSAAPMVKASVAAPASFDEVKYVGNIMVEFQVETNVTAQ